MTNTAGCTIVCSNFSLRGKLVNQSIAKLHCANEIPYNRELSSPYLLVGTWTQLSPRWHPRQSLWLAKSTFAAFLTRDPHNIFGAALSVTVLEGQSHMTISWFSDETLKMAASKDHVNSSSLRDIFLGTGTLKVLILQQVLHYRRNYRKFRLTSHTRIARSSPASPQKC